MTSDQVVSARPELMRRINRTLILDLLQREGRLSRSGLAAKSGMSLPAVSKTVAELINDGWVTEVGPGLSSGGRRPVLLEVNPKAGHVVAVDATPFRLRGAVADLTGELLVTEVEAPRRLGLPLLEQLTGFIERLTGAGERLASEGCGPLAGVGLAVPGIPDRAGTRVRLAPALDWSDVPVGETLQNRLGFPVLVQNDVDAMLLGEQWRGAAQGLRHAVALYVGAGVGAATLLDGQLYRGRDGAAGELGYWLTDPAQEPTTAGYGRLEGQLSMVSLTERWARETAGAPADEAEVLGALIDGAAAGDPAAAGLVDEEARLLGMAVVNLVTLLNPEAVILGGEVLRLRDLVLPVVNQMVRDHTPFPTKVVPAALGDHSTLIGAIYGVIQQKRSSVTYMK